MHTCIRSYLHMVQNAPLARRRGKGHLYRAESPPGTNVWHLYQVSHPVQMLHLICTRWLVPVGYSVQMRVTNWYK
jgi:hypothetical protein